MDPQQPLECAQRFGNALVRLEKTEHADERRIDIEAQLVADAQTVGLGNPGAMRDDGDRAFIPGIPDISLHVVAVDDHAARRVQNAAQHRHAVVIGADLKRLHTSRIGERLRPAVELHFAQVRIPVVALDGALGDQVMQVRFVHDHHAGCRKRLLVDETVIAVVADLVKRYIEGGCDRRT